MGDVVQFKRKIVELPEVDVDVQLDNTVESLKTAIGRMPTNEMRLEYMFRLVKQLVTWICLTQNGSAELLVEWVKKSVFNIRKEL